MKIDKIITLANKKVQLQFLAMVRSLRATGCNLPVWVIPFNNDKFDLPDGCIWWEIEPLLNWTKEHSIFEMCRKYQCFLTSNYQYVDSDIIFLRNPEEVLKDVDGFVSSCTHWNNPDHTFNAESKTYFLGKSTTWQMSVFNAGQFACDQQLYTLERLKETCLGPFYKTLMQEINIYKDQVAINLLVQLTDVQVTNLTLPPFFMQSTWAGDYEEEGIENHYWNKEELKPYLLHWAGIPVYKSLSVNKYFRSFLSEEELQTWDTFVRAAEKKSKQISVHRLRVKFHEIKKALDHAY